MPTYFSNASGNTGGTAATSLSFNLTTTGGGDNCTVLIGITYQSTRTISGVTFNGDTCTLVTTVTNGGMRLSVYKKENAAVVASGSVVVSFSGTTHACGAALAHSSAVEGLTAVTGSASTSQTVTTTPTGFGYTVAFCGWANNFGSGKNMNPDTGLERATDDAQVGAGPFGTDNYWIAAATDPAEDWTEASPSNVEVLAAITCDLVLPDGYPQAILSVS